MENKELKENKIENKYGIEYTKVGDYYIPNLVLEKKEKIVLNKYGRLRLKFLKENKKAEYTIMFMNGTLNKHFAEKMWSEYQVVVATHLDTGTYHNHFVVNSVNMFTGKKFNCNKGAYYHFRELSDGLCREYGLTIIEKPKGKTPRSIYFAEKRGEPTKYNVIRKTIDEAMEMCINLKR